MKEYKTTKEAKADFHAGLITFEQLKDVKAGLFIHRPAATLNRAFRRKNKTGIAGPRRLEK